MCCVPLNIVIYAGGICMNNKIRFFWKKLFLVYMITFCMAIMVIFFVSVYSYAVNIMRVSGDYVSNIATAVRDNIDIELKQYSNILHSVSSADIERVIDNKDKYGNEKIYTYHLAQQLQNYADRVNGINGVCFIDNDGIEVGIGVWDQDKIHHIHNAELEKMNELDGQEVWNYCNGSIVLSKKLYAYSSAIKPIGYIHIMISENRLIDICSSSKKDKDIFLILGDADNIVLSSDDGLKGKNAQEIDIKDRSCVYGRNRYQIYYEKSNEFNLTYEYLMNKTLINNGIYMIILRFLLISLGFSIILMLIVKKIYKHHGKPISEMLNCMNNVKKGDLTVRVKYEDNDEIGLLSKEFNKMIEKVDEQVNCIMQMEIQVKDAQLLAYENQTNPHFLYNTLDLVRMMSINGENDKIENVVINLSKILRYNLSQEVSVTLESEIECAKNYFDIWYVRMENKFEYEFDIDESLLQCRVIKFIIQPLIENAIKHGIEPMERKDGFVTVIVQKHFNRVIINVTDNGVGITEDCLMKIKEKFEKPDSSDKHIGLQNLYKRLVLFYGRENIFMDIFSTVNKSTQVLVEIPYREN